MRRGCGRSAMRDWRSEEHTSELQSQSNLVCRLLLEKKKKALVHCDSANRIAAMWMKHRLQVETRHDGAAGEDTSLLGLENSGPTAVALHCIAPKTAHTAQRFCCLCRAKLLVASKRGRRVPVSFRLVVSEVWVLFVRCLVRFYITRLPSSLLFFFFLNNTAPPEIYPLPLHAALPIGRGHGRRLRRERPQPPWPRGGQPGHGHARHPHHERVAQGERHGRRGRGHAGGDHDAHLEIGRAHV